MRLVWTSTAILISLAGPPLADGSYVIKLKNGKEYLTARYWQEGGQILFDVYGGVFGVQRAFVAGIERASQLRSIQTADRENLEVAGTNLKTEKISNDEPKNQEPRPKPQRPSSDPITSEFNRLRDRSKQVDSLLTSEILELLKEITAFKNKLSKESRLFIEYGREFNDAHEIGDVVESALRARTQ